MIHTHTQQTAVRVGTIYVIQVQHTCCRSYLSWTWISDHSIGSHCLHTSHPSPCPSCSYFIHNQKCFGISLMYFKIFPRICVCGVCVCAVHGSCTLAHWPALYAKAEFANVYNIFANIGPIGHFSIPNVVHTHTMYVIEPFSCRLFPFLLALYHNIHCISARVQLYTK